MTILSTRPFIKTLSNLLTRTLRRLLVVLPIADNTMIGLSSGKLKINCATSRILRADATDDPPNFMTVVKSWTCSVNGRLSRSFTTATPASEQARSAQAAPRDFCEEFSTNSHPLPPDKCSEDNEDGEGNSNNNYNKSRYS